MQMSQEVASEKSKILVGDIGGTNARLALCDAVTGEITEGENYATADYESLEIVIKTYLEKQAAKGNQHISRGCLAIASAITSDQVNLTNNNWSFSISALKANLGFSHLSVINDFTAVSMAIPVLKPEDVTQFGGGAAQPNKPIAVYGAGTGLGASYLIPANGKWVTFPAEGGHVEFAPTTDEEVAIMRGVRDEVGRVSAERILSGMGLVNIYRALCKANGKTPEALEPKDITERGLAKSCDICYQTLDHFCRILGRFGGNLALTLGAFGGVYMAGGIVPRFLDFFAQSDFRAGFEDKGRFSDYTKAIPVFLITHPQTGLLGAGAFIRQELGYVL